MNVVFSELYQALTLKMSYFLDLENYIELMVLLFATMSISCYDSIRDETEVSAYIRGFAAIGICLAWLELIFLIGSKDTFFGVLLRRANKNKK